MTATTFDTDTIPASAFVPDNDLSVWDPTPAPDFETARAAWHQATAALGEAEEACWHYTSEADYRALCAARETAARTEITAFAAYMAATKAVA
jgi:hypothetical protein